MREVAMVFKRAIYERGFIPRHQSVGTARSHEALLVSRVVTFVSVTGTSAASDERLIAGITFHC